MNRESYYLDIINSLISGNIKKSDLSESTFEEAQEFLTKKMTFPDPYGMIYHIKIIPDELKTKEMCLAAVRHDAKLLQYVPRELLTKDMCEVAVKNDPLALNIIPIEMTTKEMCVEAIKKDPMYFRFVPIKFLTEEICINTMNNWPNGIKFIPDNLLTNKICVTAVKNDGLMLSYIPEKLKTKDVCLEALKSLSMRNLNSLKLYEDILKEIPDKVKDEEFWRTAVRMNKLAFEYVPEIKDLNIPSLHSYDQKILQVRFEFNEKKYTISFKDNDYSISEFQSWDNYREGLHISDFVLYDDLKDDYLVEAFSVILEVKEQYLDQEPDIFDNKEVMTVGEEER